MSWRERWQIPSLRFRRRSDTGPIGLVLGAEGLHAVQLDRRGGSVELRAAVAARSSGAQPGLPGSPKELRAFVAQALRGGRFHGRRVVTVAPAEDTKLMVLHYQLAPKQSDAEAILGLVKDRVGAPLEECIVDFLPIRTSGERQERSALAAVVRREPLLAFLERLRDAGLEAEAVEIVPVALRRLVAWLGRDETLRNALVVHCGQRRSDVTVLWGRRLLLYHEIDFGEEQTIEDVARTLCVEPELAVSMLRAYGIGGGSEVPVPGAESISAAEIAETVAEILRPSFQALAEHVRKALVYTASRMRGGSVDEIQLLGRIAGWPGAEKLLAEWLGLPVRLLDVSRAFPRLGELPPSSELALAAGLALRGMVDDG